MDSSQRSFALSASGDQIFVVDNGEAVAGLHTGGGWSSRHPLVDVRATAGPRDRVDHVRATPDAYCYEGIRGRGDDRRAPTDALTPTRRSGRGAAGTGRSPFFVSDAAGGLNGTDTAASTVRGGRGVVGAAAVVAMVTVAV